MSGRVHESVLANRIFVGGKGGQGLREWLVRLDNLMEELSFAATLGAQQINLVAPLMTPARSTFFEKEYVREQEDKETN